MSNMGRFYSIDALDFVSDNDGIQLSFGGETLTIKIANSSRLQYEDFQYSDLFDLWHIGRVSL